jgi:hypothetical protein
MAEKKKAAKKTATKRNKKEPSAGPGKLTGANGIGTRFSSDNQPTGEAKSAGHKKRRMLKDILELTFAGPKGSKLKKTAAAYLGLPEEEITVEDMLNFRQIERAIGKSNTFAYMAVMDRAFGKPVQAIKPEDDEGFKIKVTLKGGNHAGGGS